MSAEANAAGGFLRRIIIAAMQDTEELTAQITELRKELAKVNAAAEQNTEALGAPVAQLQAKLEEELSSVAQLRAKLEEDSSRGFLGRLFGPQPQTSQDRQDMERIREATRRRIAYILIATLLAVVVGTIAYIVGLSTVAGWSTQELINLMQGLGTTLLAPIVGLIGAVIGFYYGGQTAVSGTETIKDTATGAARDAATGAARAAATDAATKAATDAAQRATDAATEVAKQAAAGAARDAAAEVVRENR